MHSGSKMVLALAMLTLAACGGGSGSDAEPIEVTTRAFGVPDMDGTVFSGATSELEIQDSEYTGGILVGELGHAQGASVARGIFTFELEGIPADARIKEAYLYLYQYEVVNNPYARTGLTLIDNWLRFRTSRETSQATKRRCDIKSNRGIVGDLGRDGEYDACFLEVCCADRTTFRGLCQLLKRNLCHDGDRRFFSVHHGHRGIGQQPRFRARAESVDDGCDVQVTAQIHQCKEASRCANRGRYDEYGFQAEQTRWLRSVVAGFRGVIPIDTKLLEFLEADVIDQGRNSHLRARDIELDDHLFNEVQS